MADAQEIEALNDRIISETPNRGYHFVPLSNNNCENGTNDVLFSSMPISNATLRGLHNNKHKKFVTMTDIQHAVIPHALAGRDILGAARTGSGKTLAFLVPLLERLYRVKWGQRASTAQFDNDCYVYGVGALVLSPTRELAVQIFEVLRSIGAYHRFSAGLLVGGKKEFRSEQSRVSVTHVLIATPGRLLQHLEQTPGFDYACADLQVLVLDEADRILDLGFQKQLFCILDYLPQPDHYSSDIIRSVDENNHMNLHRRRQTMLFSATQPKSVRDLAKLSLDKPEYIGVHDKLDITTPDKLEQMLLVCSLPQKLDVIYSFIKSHMKTKTIIFFSSCSQVRHVYELFCSMQPGVPLLSLHGRIKQARRTHIYFDFLNKPHAILFATDIAARGLDFPNVDWVVQADAPEDKDMYIHRVGRTARYTAGGRSLLCLLPSEYPGMMKILSEAKMPIKKLSVNPSKAVSVTKRAASIVASNPETNRLAKKAFQSYLRSVYLMPNKDIFKVTELPFDDYALSLGLSSAPSTRFLKTISNRDNLRESKNTSRKLQRLKDQIKAEKLQKRVEKYGADAKLQMKQPSREESDEEDVLIVKKRHTWESEKEANEMTSAEVKNVDINRATARPTKKIRLEASHGLNKRITFNDDGEEVDTIEQTITSATETIDNLVGANDEYLKRVRERLASNKDIDDAEAKARIREKHRKQRLEKKAATQQNHDVDDEGGNTVLLPVDEDEHSDESESVSGHSSGGSNSDSDQSDDLSVAAQENLALELLRKR